MHVMVTGSSGLIGRWVCERLDQERVSWIGVDLKEAVKPEWRERHRRLDLLDGKALCDLLRDEQCDAVIHLAARTDLDGRTLADYAVNVDGVRNLCEAVNRSGTIRRVLYTSSQLVCRVGYVPRDDRDYCPHTVYGQSKVMTENIVRELDGGGVEWALIRPTTVWGPYMGPHYQSLLKYIRQGKFFHSGPGKLYKSYSYAGNCAYQYYKFLTADAGEINRRTFFQADYEPLSLRDYADALAREMKAPAIRTMPLILARGLALLGDCLNLLGSSFPYNSFRLNNIRTEYIFDLSATEKVCGPLPYSFAEGVAATAEWYLNRS